MSLVSGDDALLEKSLRLLLTAWGETASAWRDQARSDFQDLHLAGIEDRARQAIRSIRAMQTLIDEVERQCK
jgi:hypothetical protein